MRKPFLLMISFVLALAIVMLPRGGTATVTNAKVDSQLRQFFNTHLPGATLPVVITYRQRPGSIEFSRLQLAGVVKGFATRELPMVIADLNVTQLEAVRNQPGVVSIYGNRLMKTFTNVSRPFIGVPQMQADQEVTGHNASNPGFPVTGKGVTIGYVDTVIDATHRDLLYGTKTVQNVIQPLSETVVSDAGLVGAPGVSIGDLVAGTGFVPPVYLQNKQQSDIESGHGTFGAAVATGTGEMSGGFYGGVAKGARLVGVNSGNELGLPLVGLIGAYDYLLANQSLYNIRGINNSWGSSLDADGLDPLNPINVATRTAHDVDNLRSGG